MLQVRRRLDLGEEPLGAECRGEIGVQHLDRDLAVVLEVVREVDRGHAARAELALDAVAVGEGRAETQEWGARAQKVPHGAVLDQTREATSLEWPATNWCAGVGSGTGRPAATAPCGARSRNEHGHPRMRCAHGAPSLDAPLAKV